MKHTAFVLAAIGLLSLACLWPAMIPLSGEAKGPLPVMEENAEKVLEALQGGEYILLEAVAPERYTVEDVGNPGTLTFTVKLTGDKPVYFSYGWCATTEEVLKRNFEHMQVELSINSQKLGKDVVHPIRFRQPDGLVCLDLGVLITEWPAGEYKLKAAATFEEKINDGIADYEAGDYIMAYTVEVAK